MKLEFKQQESQTDAVTAVVDGFHGQPLPAVQSIEPDPASETASPPHLALSNCTLTKRTKKDTLG
jgi:hypothetical protein